jgi:holliday junction DNA helicase RuvA
LIFTHHIFSQQFDSFVQFAHTSNQQREAFYDKEFKMIGSLHGTVLAKSSDGIILDVHGVGYDVFSPASSLCAIAAEGELASIWTELVVREDSQRLFGFATLGCKRVFQMLTAVSGIGPKAALSLLGPYTGAELCDLILRGDVKQLTRIPGVGAKTAERIVLELKSKCEKIMILLASEEFAKEPPTANTKEIRSVMGAQASPAEPIHQNLLFDDPIAAGLAKTTSVLPQKTPAQASAHKRAIFSEVKSALENMGYKEKVFSDIAPELENQFTKEGQNTLELLLRYTLRRITDRMVKVENA